MSDKSFMDAMISAYKRTQPCLGPWRIRPLRWRTSWAIEWKPQDLWIGAFWKHTELSDGNVRGTDVWICLLPCIPIHIWWYENRVWQNAIDRVQP